MKNKQSSIEWLVEEINKQKAWADPSKLEPLFEQAKAMHKEQIIDAYRRGFISDDIKLADDYYNETFGGNND